MKKNNISWIAVFVTLLIVLFVSFTFTAPLNNLIGVQLNLSTIKSIKPIEYSDKISIKSTLYRFKQSIKFCNVETFLRCLSEDFQDSLGVNQGKDYAKQLFNQNFLNFKFEDRSPYSIRRIPENKKVTQNWDFELIIKEIDVKKNNKKAKVICDVFYMLDQPDIELESGMPIYLLMNEEKLFKKNKNSKDKIKNDEKIKKEKKPKYGEVEIDLKFKNNQWQINKINNFFKFLEKRNKKLIKEKYVNSK